MAAVISAAQSLSALLRRTHLDDHEEVLKAANAALKKSKSDLEAQHVKVVALLKLDRFDDALGVLEEGGQRLKERAQLEHAYALYKAGNPAEAVEIVGTVDRSRGILHVEAQARYRSEDFERAAITYRQLMDQTAEARSEESDLRINSGAADAQLEWAGQGHLAQKKKPTREDLEAFETAYNAACGSIARGELGQDLCNALDELSEEEKIAEILPITVQQIYVLTQQGRLEEAEKLAASLTIADIPDLSTRYIAQVNHLASSTDSTNPYLSHRLFHSSPKLLNTDRTFAFQSSILHRDAYVMDLQSSKFTGVASSTSTYLSKQPSPTTSADVNSISVLNAAAHARNTSGKAALKEILPLLEKRPNDVGLLLTIVQLYLLTGNHGSAITLFESFFARLEKSSTRSDQDVRFAPGLVATVVGLYKMEGRTSHIRTELAKAASHWRRKSKESSAQSPPQASLLKAAGVALLDSSRAEDLAAAVSIFSDLHTRDPTDRFSTAGFIAAYATTSPSKITPDDLATLTETKRLTADVDAAALEAAGVARPAPPPSTTLPTSTKKRAADPATSTKAKRPRKSRLPKDYDPSRTPDPERWLPLRDRSSYRPKGRKGKQRQQALTQGGVSEDSRPATPALGGEVVKGTGGAGKGKKKAKAKGGKW
ncbi:hypothetical protein B0A49_03582 [Cryomyces minteri]|uniref:Signal recognition particle subunit SRP72 n=1 Tax=Cryomyces minteri TaxID=331657 RepID=A0A4U0X9N7_9PEZI|nr:hypothetical protein B0A49_03582 [Cryomyces minteri]